MKPWPGAVVVRPDHEAVDVGDHRDLQPARRRVPDRVRHDLLHRADDGDGALLVQR
nr:hypothetical protein [Georgenia muralis]